LDKVALEKAFAEEKEKLERTEQLLAKEQAQFEDAKNDLEMKIVYELNRVKDLSSQLEREQDSFQKKKDELELAIAKEKQNVDNVETQLKQEQLRMTEETTKLKGQVEEGRRLQRVKAKEMSQKFRKIREQLLSRWQEEKRNVRMERKELTEKYDNVIAEASESVKRLETDLAGARQSSEELRVMFDEMTREKELLLEEREESEERYRRTLMNRDGIILDLRRELDKLYDDIYDRDQTITKYESSLRELLGLSVQLTKRRVGRVFRRRETDEFE
jgi:chromosome segregation ATPase